MSLYPGQSQAYAVSLYVYIYIYIYIHTPYQTTKVMYILAHIPGGVAWNILAYPLKKVWPRVVHLMLKYFPEILFIAFLS